MARPPKEINWDLVKKKMEAGCSAKEIFSSHETKMGHDTFYQKFKEHFGCSFQDYKDECVQRGEGDLRMMLHAKAMQGNLTALLFLAKCKLGMKEPDNANALSALQNQIDQSHEIMRLQHRISELEANADKSQTE